MEKYLYGASVQGIQSFIFKTNKLKEIIGASEIVEQICTSFFKENVKNFTEENLIIGAAGNIKYVFDNEQECKELVRVFPKKVMEFAPGITISQAVETLKKKSLSDSIDNLEAKIKSQRNILSKPIEIGFMGLERARRTGGIAIEYIDDECTDYSSLKKNNENSSKIFNDLLGEKANPNNIAFNIEDITRKDNSWIAVVHADGNGLGNILQNLGQILKECGDNNKIQKAFKDFSQAIDRSTKAAAKYAFENVITKVSGKEKYPIRPVLIGGDDLTIIIRADLALKFTELFLTRFEIETAKEFKILEAYGILNYKKGITACAGIAFIKKSYPFHYGVHLAESLCGDAKFFVKNTVEMDNGLPKSSLSFYKVQESFVEDLKILKNKTMKTKTNLNYFAGPYLIEQSKIHSNTVDLNDKLILIKEEADKNDKTKAVGKLRQIVSETYKDKSTAIFMLKRMQEINKDFYKALKLDNELNAIESNGTSQLVDLITLHGFNYGN